jgi:hypothetical protein
MSYADHAFIALKDCYYFATKCQSFISSTRNLSGSWENMALHGNEQRYTINGVPRKAYVVRSYGVPIAAKVPVIHDGSMRWLISTDKYSVTTAKHVSGLMREIGPNYYWLSNEKLIKEMLER